MLCVCVHAVCTCVLMDEVHKSVWVPQHHPPKPHIMCAVNRLGSLSSPFAEVILQCEPLAAKSIAICCNHIPYARNVCIHDTR